MKEEPEDLVLFLGAGASMPFGIPGMREFIELLDSAIGSGEIPTEEGEKELWQKLLTVGEQENEQTDLEWILSTLNFLSEHDLPSKIKLLNFTFDEDILEDMQSKARNLKEKVQECIKEKCVVRPERRNDAATYYRQFFEELLNARGYHPKIFTTNYDNVIEVSNKERNLGLDPETDPHRPKIVLVNGFLTPNESRRRIWDPRAFEVRIIGGSVSQYFFKLHGSIDWYAASSDILEIPVVAQKIKLINGEEAGSLLIYPVEGKRIFSPPFTELFYQFRAALLYEARILLVVGYSFRDEIFQKLLKEALDRNKSLRIFMANTDMEQIERVQSEFGRDRVVPITEAFGTGDFMPSLSDKLWKESQKTIIYQAEHLPKNDLAKVVEDPGAMNGIAVELKSMPSGYGAIYGPYRPLPESGKYKITCRMKMMLEPQLSQLTHQPIARIDISPAPDIRIGAKYKDRKYPELHLNVSDFRNSYEYVPILTELEYEDEPLMEYRIQSAGIIPVRVDRITIEKSG